MIIVLNNNTVKEKKFSMISNFFYFCRIIKIISMKKNIALLLGGDSAEAVISKKSADHLLNYLDSALYEVYPITVKGTSWTYLHHGDLIDVDKNDFSLFIDGSRVCFDCAIPLIHGTPCEDGRLQAYFELMRIPYIT